MILPVVNVKKDFFKNHKMINSVNLVKKFAKPVQISPNVLVADKIRLETFQIIVVVKMAIFKKTPLIYTAQNVTLIVKLVRVISQIVLLV